MDIRFEVPVTVKASPGAGEMRLKNAKEANDYLLNNWTGKRSDKHRAALQACHDAIAGEKPVMNARRAFVAAVRENDALISDKA